MEASNRRPSLLLEVLGLLSEGQKKELLNKLLPKDAQELISQVGVTDDLPEFDGRLFAYLYSQLALDMYTAKRSEDSKGVTVEEQNLASYKSQMPTIDMLLRYAEAHYNKMMALHDLIVPIEKLYEVNEDKDSMFTLLKNAKEHYGEIIKGHDLPVKIQWPLFEMAETGETNTKKIKKATPIKDERKEIKAIIGALRSGLARLERDYPATSLIELYLWLDNLWEEDDESDWQEMQRLKALCYHLLPVPLTKTGREIQVRNGDAVQSKTEDDKKQHELLFELNGLRKVNFDVSTIHICPIKWCECPTKAPPIYEHCMKMHSEIPFWNDNDRNEYRKSYSFRNSVKNDAEKGKEHHDALYKGLQHAWKGYLKSELFTPREKTKMYYHLFRIKHVRDICQPAKPIVTPDEETESEEDREVDREEKGPGSGHLDKLRRRLASLQAWDHLYGTPVPDFGIPLESSSVHADGGEALSVASDLNSLSEHADGSSPEEVPNEFDEPLSANTTPGDSGFIGTKRSASFHINENTSKKAAKTNGERTVSSSIIDLPEGKRMKVTYKKANRSWAAKAYYLRKRKAKRNRYW
jgi:hypothetical protein